MFRFSVFFTLAAVSLSSLGELGAQAAPTRRERPIAVEVGTLHPVSGPAIKNGVVVLRAGRIFNIGPADKVRIPRNSVVLSYPDGHAYPGLVDAMSAAFASPRDLADRSTNAGTDFADALDPSDKESGKLIQYGITTAYVANRSTATWRGLGAILRPVKGGFTILPKHQHGGISLRMTTGSASSHALDRLKAFDKTGNVFDSIEDYQKKQADYKAALETYAKQRKAYLAHFDQKKTSKAPAKATKTESPKAAKSAPDKSGSKSTKAAADGGSDAGPTRGPRRREGSGRRSGGSSRSGRRPSSRRPGGTTASKTATKSSTKSGGKAPTKPKYPKKVAKDPAKEALLKVIEGTLPLRVEVHRKDEIRAALFMVLTKELPGITLELATEAGELATEIAQSGAPVVLTDLLPGPDRLTKDRDGRLAAKLHRAGVPVAIGSGTVRNARNLTLMAALAAGKGLPEDAAVQALTLIPAKILGLDGELGSLEKNKLADLIITSGPLLSSDSRILRVFSGGKTQYEAKR